MTKLEAMRDVFRAVGGAFIAEEGAEEKQRAVYLFTGESGDYSSETGGDMEVLLNYLSRALGEMTADCAEDQADMERILMLLQRRIADGARKKWAKAQMEKAGKQEDGLAEKIRGVTGQNDG